MVGEAFTFRVPDEMTSPDHGGRVRVRIGKTAHEGVVLGFPTSPEVAMEIHDIEAVLETPVLQLARWQCELIMWMSDWYFSPLHKVLRLFMPQPLWKGSFSPRERIMVHPHVSAEHVPPRQKQARALVERLHRVGPAQKEVLREEFSLAAYKKALSESYIREESLGLRPVQTWTKELSQPRLLTKEQKEIVLAILQKPGESALLYGVTGAGKTEMYLHIALQMKQRGKQTALLVPEIALTPQLVQYFQRVFGERVAVVHSHIAEGEKCQEWLRVARHEVDVVIGSRSAIFAPFANLGQIIVDEEHEWTYKNEQNPRYLIHRVAEQLIMIFKGQQKEVSVLFASGTPGIERFARAKGDVLASRPLHLFMLEQKIFEQTEDSSN